MASLVYPGLEQYNCIPPPPPYPQSYKSQASVKILIYMVVLIAIKETWEGMNCFISYNP